MLSKYHLIEKRRLFGATIRPTLLLFLLALILVSVLPAVAQLVVRPLTHNGYLRPYLIFRPAHSPAHPAAVLMLGGIRSTAKSEAQHFGWMEQAERDGFLAVFPEPIATRPDQPADRKSNVTFWEMQGSRTHLLAPGKQPVDDDGYLSAVLRDVLRRDHPDRKRIFLAGFSSGSGMVQLFASRHSRQIGWRCGGCYASDGTASQTGPPRTHPLHPRRR